MHVGIIVDATRVEISETCRVLAKLEFAAMGAGFWSMTSVIDSTRRSSVGDSLLRSVTGTIAASSARTAFRYRSRRRLRSSPIV